MWNPFKKLAEKDEQMRVALQNAVTVWETRMIRGQYTLLPYAHQVLHNDGGTYQMHVLDEMEAAAWERLRERDDFETIRAGWKLEHMRVWDRKAYEAIMVRKEVEELRAKVAKLEGIETMLALGTA